MSDETPLPKDCPLVVASNDAASARAMERLLAELGFPCAAAPANGVGRGATDQPGSWVLIDVKTLAALLADEHEAGEEAQGARADAALPDETRFLARAAQLLASSQPPNDQVALLYVKFAAPELPPPQTAELHKEIVRRLRACVRERDSLGTSPRPELEPSLAQVGDQQFTLLLPGLSRNHVAFKVAQRVQGRFTTPIELPTGPITITPSIGIALHPSDSRDAATLLEYARAAQVAVENAGTAGIRFYTPAMNSAALQRLTLESALRKAVERGELIVHYQPKVQIATGRIVGAEALVRWKHPELGLVSPGQFIPIAEETGLIGAIGEHVLDTACRQAKEWQDAGLPPIRMAVNLSTVQMREPTLLETLRRIIKASGLAPDWVELEITESVLLQNVDAMIATLQQLKQTGVHLSIDDFGTGYSSLSYLKRFPIDSLKIDQAFIRELTTNPDDAAITTSIILMGKSLKLNVVAEGVETRSQLALLHVLECDEAQGFLFSKAIAADDFRKVLEKGIDPMLVPRRD